MPVRIVICKARRAGLSTGVEALIYDDTTTHPNTNSLIVANERNPSENVLEMNRTFWKYTPEKFNIGGHMINVRPEIPAVFRNNPPRDRMEFAEPLNSKIFVATARSIDAYLGYGFQNIHATEASRYNDGHELFRALYPTLSTDPHSALYVESTPNGQEGKGRWFYEQCLSSDTEVLTKRGFLGVDEITSSDMVAAFDAGRISFCPILGKTDRALGAGEEMYELKAPGIDLRVTGGHRLLRAKRGSKYEFIEAADLAKETTGYTLPVAGVEDSPGCDLTDHELTLLGWFLTDGHLHKTNSTLSIAQAEHQPYHDEIKRCIEGCGIYYSTYRSTKKDLTIKQTSPLITYSMPKLANRKHHVGKRGWLYLKPWLDKDFSPLFEDLTCAQLAVLLKAMQNGDGNKQRTIRFKQRSYAIGTGRKCVADRVQSLCIRRGWRCSIAVRISPNGKPDYYTIRARPRDERYVSGSGKRTRSRPSLQLSPRVKGERVWCVTNDLGTLVTRRNGKTAIVGNCMDAAARKETQYGEMSLVFIPWQEMTFSFSIPFASDEKRAAFLKTLNQSESDLLKRFPLIKAEQLNWRRMMISGPTFNRDEDVFDQEFPTDLASCFLTSGTSVYGRKHIKRLLTYVRPPIWEGDVYWGDSDDRNEREAIHDTVRRPRLMTKGDARAVGRRPHTNERTYNNLKIFRHIRKNERVFVCCDVGGGQESTVDGDESTISVGVLNELNVDELVMTWRGHINPIAFAEVASALCWAVRYQVGDAVVAPLLAPEWTGPGVGMCTYIDQKNLYPNLYRYQQPGVHKMPSSKHIGWESNAKTKPLMVGYSVRMVRDDLIDIPDIETVTQMSSYRQIDQYGDAGSFGGAAGRHDDLVSSFQILCAILRLHSATVPGDAEVEEVDMEGGPHDPDLPVFDPFTRAEPDLGWDAPWGNSNDLDNDSMAETLFWTVDDED